MSFIIKLTVTEKSATKPIAWQYHLELTAGPRQDSENAFFILCNWLSLWGRTRGTKLTVRKRKCGNLKGTHLGVPVTDETIISSEC